MALSDPDAAPPAENPAAVAEEMAHAVRQLREQAWMLEGLTSPAPEPEPPTERPTRRPAAPRPRS
jgi:hypothetical protein